MTDGETATEAIQPITETCARWAIQPSPGSPGQVGLGANTTEGLGLRSLAVSTACPQHIMRWLCESPAMDGNLGNLSLSLFPLGSGLSIYKMRTQTRSGIAYWWPEEHLVPTDVFRLGCMFCFQGWGEVVLNLDSFKMASLDTGSTVPDSLIYTFMYLPGPDRLLRLKIWD